MECGLNEKLFEILSIFVSSMYMSVCKNAEEDGVFVLHGNRGSFHNEKQPAFKAIYSSFEQVLKL